MRAWLIACLLAISPVAQAEVFYGIEFNDSFNEIKAKFPNATFVNVDAAWIKPSQSLISMTGGGIKSTVVMQFERFHRTLIDKDPGDNLRLWSVKIIYKQPIGFNEFKKKYGLPSKCIKDEDFEIFCDFMDHAITARISSDGNFVYYVNSHFTMEEQDRMLIDSTVRRLKRKQEKINSPVEAPLSAPAT